MFSDTIGSAASSAFDKYRGATAPAAENGPMVSGGLALHCTAAFTLISALTLPFGLGGSTSAMLGTATMQHHLPPIAIWRTSQDALSQAEINILMAKLERLKKYRSGWAGPGSLAAAPKALVVAGDFIHSLPAAGISAPNRINLSSDGEISFYWKRRGASLDLGINRQSRVSYYARLSDGSQIIQDAKTGLPRLDPKLINALS